MTDHHWIKHCATPILAAALAFGSALSGLAHAATPVFSAVGSLSPDDGSNAGTIDIDVYSFDLTSLAPAYVATLSDSALFGAEFIGMTLFSPSAIVMGSLLGAGSFTFVPSEPGTYSIYVAGKASKPHDLDFYGVGVSHMPEADTWTMLLVGLGIMASRLLRKERFGTHAII
jgi:hypothetical protein